MPAPDNPLFTAADLTGLLHREVTEDDAATAERVVWGWLKPVLGLSERPVPVPDDVFSWALELGGIAYANPTGGGRRQLGSLSVDPGARRDAILEAAGSTSVTHAPRGAFPPAPRYPDPAC